MLKSYRFDSKRLKIAGLILLSLLLTGMAQAEVSVPASWQGLEAGEFAVGFATIEKFDQSRTFRPSQDYFGNAVEGETARPVQICYWYPAVTDESSLNMLYGQYAYPYPEDSRFIDLLSGLQNRDLRLLTFFLRNNRGLLTEAMNTQLYGVRDAAWAEGQFPIIVVHNDANSTFTQNLILCEYLASHGYIVMTTHGIGPASLDPTRSAIDVETLTRDKEFALGAMFELEQVDKSRVGVLGNAFGVLTSLIQSMRSPEIGALVLMESTARVENRDELLTGSIFYQPGRMTAPILQVYSGGTSEAEDKLTAMFGYSDRTTINRTGAQSMDFMSYPLITGLLVNPDSGDQAHANYVATCTDIAGFFDATFKQANASHSLVEKYATDETVAIATHQGDKVPPTASQFLAMFTSGNVEQAIELEEEFKMFTPGNAPVDEATLNNMGYRFLQMRDHQTAQAIFKMATAGYPESPNVWDSYGEGCMSAGDYTAALESYGQALKLAEEAGDELPKNVRESILNNVPATIEQLKQLIAEQGTSTDGTH